MAEASAWMPLYIGDYLADTMHLDGPKHGAYILLIMHYWRSGPLPDNDDELAAIARTDIKDWKKRIGPSVRRFFRVEEGLLRHKRIDAELANASKNIEQKRMAAQARWNRTDTARNADADAPALRLESPSPSPSPSPKESAAASAATDAAAAIFENGKGKPAKPNGRFHGFAGKMPNLTSPWSAWEILTDGEVEVYGPNAQRRPCAGGFYVDEVARLVADAARIDGYQGHIDWRPIIGWLKAGLDSEQIATVIKRIASKPDYEPKTNLKYFTPALTEYAGKGNYIVDSLRGTS